MADQTKKQTNLRLELADHERLEAMAERADMKRATLAKEIIVAALDEVDQAGSSSLAPGTSKPPGEDQSEYVMERLDDIEGHVRRLETTIHLTLRSVLGTLLTTPEELEAMRSKLDDLLGPLPSRPTD
tara:strand:+ start:1271 stop:1654 length:384 start_codon:yes stop_codon:yes gene_type:complete